MVNLKLQLHSQSNKKIQGTYNTIVNNNSDDLSD